ncbi:MAG: M23 family metallopeptidase [Bacteroidales bacterium]|nr:M23 family metallopeptidase [Bacteroidales bacterium]MCM1146421.1 M23 family metallopeptidase [Bacteroidales bacterium]MCM1205141.1 M23 family metallopeptidase [Bacillota bacterium]MCM1509388.1 M23 family metallopeptidase [Clostridium sp.]
MKKKIIMSMIVCTLYAVTGIQAQATFTVREQEAISCETPGLFERSSAFTVDFGQMKEKDYSFPLPVGKVDGIRSNNNISISSSEGDAVKAMFSGVVRLSRSTQQMGNTIVVRHDNGLETVYGNNAQNLVKVGDRVTAGQTIAIIGTRNNKTYCEFAVMVNGARLNPETLLELRSHRLRRQTLLFQKQSDGILIKVVTEEKEQTLQKQAGRRQPQRGNMTKTQHTKVQQETSASRKYAKNAQYVAKKQDDEALDIDEFQAIQLEDKVKSSQRTAKEFAINFGALKPEEWAYPMKGGRVISPFGGKRRHAGTDIKTKAGDPVFAAFDGQVVLSGTHYGYGLCIIIRHGNGMETLYSHQSMNQVKAGDWVKAGQQIGIVGRTGRATTEHCHFECRINGRPFNSAKIFDHASNALRKVILTYRNGNIYVSNDANSVGERVAVHSKGSSSSASKRRTSARRSTAKRRRR